MAIKADICDTFREGNTALHLACQSNQLKVIEVLLQWGARANMTNASGFAPVSTPSASSLFVAYAHKHRSQSFCSICGPSQTTLLKLHLSVSIHVIESLR